MKITNTKNFEYNLGQGVILPPLSTITIEDEVWFSIYASSDYVRLLVFSGTIIAESSGPVEKPDLNNFISPWIGIYAQDWQNIPSSISGNLCVKVLENGVVVQIAVDDQGVLFRRAYVNGAFEDWEQLSNLPIPESEVVVVVDSTTTSAYIPVLSGGTQYIYQKPLEFLSVGSVANVTREDEIVFIDGGIVMDGVTVPMIPKVPSNVEFVNSSAIVVSSGGKYLMNFRNANLVMGELKEQADVL